MFTVLQSTDPAQLRARFPHLTVEAEYGDEVVEGSEYTAAHHQKNGPYVGDHVMAGGRPSPCVDPNIPKADDSWIVGISHIDLDTIGGIFRASSAVDLFAPARDGFWRLAAFLDVNGAHRVPLSGAEEQEIDQVYAWWAHSKLMPRLPFGGLNDVTTIVADCLPVLRGIFSNDPDLIAAGKSFREGEGLLNKESIIEDRPSGVLVRHSPQFVNHLYLTPEGGLRRAVVAWNQKIGTITISLETPIEGVSCRDIVQKLWGPLAGGHPGIAGGPRGQVMDEDALKSAVAALEEALKTADA